SRASPHRRVWRRPARVQTESMTRMQKAKEQPGEFFSHILQNFSKQSRCDSEIVELDHRVGFRPETDSAGLKCGVLRIENFFSVEPDDEMIPARLHLQRVPHVGRHLHGMVLESATAALDRV